jgi:hypothetical protein
MDIDWASLGQVSVVTVLAAVVVVGSYALGITIMSRVEEAVTSSTSTRVRTSTILARRGAAYICFAVSAGVVLYGLYTLIPQFH